MDALILDQDHGYQVEVARALVRRGFNVVCVDSIASAESFMRVSPPRALVMGERVGGRLSHSVALLGECRNPNLTAVLLTDRTGPEMTELFDLVPSIRTILGRGIDPETLGQMVVAALQPDQPTQVCTQGWTIPVPQVAIEADHGADTQPAAAPLPTIPAPAPQDADLLSDGPVADWRVAGDDLRQAVSTTPQEALKLWRDAVRPALSEAAEGRVPAPDMAAAMLPMAAQAAATLAAITAEPLVRLDDMAGPSGALTKVWPSALLRRMQTPAEDDAPAAPRQLAAAGARRLTLG